MIVGITIDKWKLSIFDRHLTKHGFAYTTHPGVADTLLLQVQAATVDTLAGIVLSANEEAKRVGRN